MEAVTDAYVVFERAATRCVTEVAGAGNTQGHESLPISIDMPTQNTLFRSFLLGSFILCSSTAFSQQTLHTTQGNALGGSFGQSVTSIGDFNNDGFDDVVVGSPLDNSNGKFAGRVTVVSGKDGAVLAARYGDNPGDQLGFSVSNLGGDANGDGFADFMAGAPYGDPNGSSSGYVRVFNGSTAATITTMNGAASGDRFGYSCAYAGSTGAVRIIIGAPYRNQAQTDAGAAYLYFWSGTFITELKGTQQGEHFGWSVGGGGNISGNADPDVIVGSPDYDDGGDDAGRVKVFSAVSPYTNHYTLSSPGPGNRFGYSVALLQNINGDGLADLIVGIPEAATGSGSIQIISGSAGTILNTFFGPAGGKLGWSVASVNDTNADGKTEYIAGAPFADSNGTDSGEVRVYNSTGSINFTIAGPSTGAQAGYSVGGGDKFNSDVPRDFVYGCPGTDQNGTDTGSAILRNGSTNAVLATVHGPAAGDVLGTSVCLIGDVNNDGFDDVAVGSPQDDPVVVFLGQPIVYVDAGSVRVISGKTGAIVYTVIGNNNGDNFGYSLAVCDDLNGDGRLDFIVGAPQMNTDAPSPGYVKVISGANGAVIHNIASVINNERFGYSVSGASDLNFDGKKDILVGAPNSSQYGLSAGHVTAYSGTTGFLLWIAHNNIANDQFGFSVAGLNGDINGDGRQDVIVGSPYNDANGSNSGRIDILSGSGGGPLFIVNGTSAGEQFGYSVSGVGDLNNDGKVDAIAGAPFRDTIFTTDGGAVSAISGFNGSILQTYYGWTNDLLGTSVTGLDDVDHDGRPDYAAGGPQFNFFLPSGTGIVEVISGRFNTRIYQLEGTATGERFGASVSGFFKGPGDINNDGLNDIAVGAPFAAGPGLFAGRADLISLAPLGVSNYGIGTPGCLGPHTFKTSGAANIGNFNFGFRGSNVPASTLGLLFITDSQDPAGTDAFGLGFKLHVDFFAATEVLNYDIFSDADHYSAVTTAVPNNPLLVGAVYFAQSLWVETDCVLGGSNIYNMSTSEGVKIIVQN